MQERATNPAIGGKANGGGNDSPPDNLPTTEWVGLESAADVWHLSPASLDPRELQRRWLERLSPEERQRRDRLATDALRHAYLSTRALCRAVLSRYVGVGPGEWAFRENSQGKPAVARPAGFASLRFNLTHTEGLVACLVTRAGEVGVDAEVVSEASHGFKVGEIERIAGHFFSAAERAALSALPPGRRVERFYEYWVLKEAYLKGLGAGLSRPTESFAIEWDETGRPRPLGDWDLALHRPTPRHVAATAVRRGGAESVPVTWRTFEEMP